MEKSSSRRTPLVAVLLVLILFSIVQCQKNTGEAVQHKSRAGPDLVPSTTPEIIRITLCALQDYSLEAALDIFKESDYEERNRIDLDIILLEYEPMLTAHKLDFTSKKRRFDLVSVDQPFLGWYVSQYWIQSLDHLMTSSLLPSLDEDDLIPVLKESCQWDGMLYSVPIGSYGAILAYRKDLFEKMNLTPPVTFEGYKETAELLNNPPEIYGTALFAHKGEYLTDDVIPFLWSWGAGLINGVDIILPDRPLYRAAWDTPEGLQALEFYASLYREGLTPPDTLNYDHQRYIRAFQEGKVAMGFMPAEGIGWPMDNPAESQVVGKIAYAPLPGRVKENQSGPPRAAIGSHSLGLSTFSKNHREAYRVLQFLTSREIGKEYILRGGRPYRTSHFFPEAMDKFPYLSAIKTEMETGKYRPGISLYPYVSSIFSTAFHGALRLHKPIAPVMKAAARKTNRELLIPEYGYQEDRNNGE